MNNYIKIAKKQLKDFINLSRYYSVRYALYNLIWWINFYIRNPYSFKISKCMLLKKTKWLDKYIESKYSDEILKFKNQTLENKKISCNRIWVYWGQGEENMPVLIRACYNQLRKNNDNVNLITNSNIKDYIDIPESIYQKLNNGALTWAHFSDIVRTTLLTKYGGLWLDATVWVPNKLSDKIFNSNFFTACSKNIITNRSICFWTSLEWNWSGWCMAVDHTNNIIENFVSTMLINLAQNEKYLLDYVLIDYFIYYVCKHFPIAEKYMQEAQSIQSTTRNELAAVMNQEYNEGKYRDLCSKSEVFKLSFRTNWNSLTADNKETFYGKLIK